ncbi:MAG: Asp-tRNA(Asn)/Glu-tRNA(Gln) amidotransferase subunit GatC [Actinobacteria bacterium]|nr:Asp-tRNA(Asn)/Glu-tRNA(Gln) amidotransferase subunit GatC [Actinomycetota bacterium]
MISDKEIQHIANLAELDLSEDEKKKMSVELSGILEHVEKIKELDIRDVEPTSHAVAMENVFRDDEPIKPLDREEILRNAPLREADSFKVPPIV